MVADTSPSPSCYLKKKIELQFISSTLDLIIIDSISINAVILFERKLQN